MNILEYIHRLHITKEYSGTPPATCPYIPKLIEEYRVIPSSVNRGIYCFLYNPCFVGLPGWGASKTGHTAENYIAIHIIFTQ
jgi:hypothetical protein